MASNLQNAASIQQPTEKQGQFEACFSTGLDLSELTAGATVGGRTSAAAELLRVKAQESERKAHEEREENRMHDVAKARAIHLEEKFSTSNRVGSLPKLQPPTNDPISQNEGRDLLIGTDIFATLVGMHGEDERHKSIRNTKNPKVRHRNRSLVKGSSSYRAPQNPSTKVTKRSAMKKGKRIKH